jgi:putative CocE/NonD family hydrolase
MKGPPAVYKRFDRMETKNDMVFLVLGPWCHGQENREGSALGAVRWDADTSLWFRRNILRPFLDQYLKDGAPKADIAPVMAFETGTNTWRRLNAWPAGCAAGCAPKATPLYLSAGGKAGFAVPKAGDGSYDEYISDPAKPVPFRGRPYPVSTWETNNAWRTWLTSDQREVSTRTDVLVYTSDVLTAPVKIAGEPVANLVASTSGTDSDWVVKVIDVYPPEVPGQPAMGGYQLAVSMDIFRGRYRESLETPKALEAGKPLLYKFALPNANHVFLPGHRIMVQVQSSWFPLYDRNPQAFVPSIFWAKPGDYVKATQRVYHAPGQASFVELPVVTTP